MDGKELNLNSEYARLYFKENAEKKAEKKITNPLKMFVPEYVSELYDEIKIKDKKPKEEKEKPQKPVQKYEEPGKWETFKTIVKDAYNEVREWDRQQSARIINAWSNSDIGALARGDFKTFWNIQKNSSVAELVKCNFSEAKRKFGEESKNLSTALGFETAKDGYREVYKEIEKAVDDGDDTKLSKAEKAVSVVGAVGEVADEWISPQGFVELAAFGGAIKGGKWLLGKTPSIIGNTLSAGLVADGSRRVGNGLYDVAAAETKEEVKEGTEKIIGGAVEAGIGVNVGTTAPIKNNAILKSETVKTPTEIAETMFERRKAISKDFPSYKEGRTTEATLQKYKELYVPQNEIIRKNIATKYGENYETIFEDTGKELPWLDSLISKSEFPADTTLYRGGSPRDFGFTKMTSDEFIQKCYKKGEYFRIPTYPETSLSESVGLKFSENTAGTPSGKRILFKINAPKGTKGLYMEKLDGKTYADYCGCEEEVILPRDSVFRFGDIIKGKDFDTIELDIVKSTPLLKRTHDFRSEIKP